MMDHTGVVAQALSIARQHNEWDSGRRGRATKQIKGGREQIERAMQVPPQISRATPREGTIMFGIVCARTVGTLMLMRMAAVAAKGGSTH